MAPHKAGVQRRGRAGRTQESKATSTGNENVGAPPLEAPERGGWGVSPILPGHMISRKTAITTGTSWRPFAVRLSREAKDPLGPRGEIPPHP